MKCRTCDRPAVPWLDWHLDRSDRAIRVAPTCTPTCTAIWSEGRRKMTDPNTHEVAAMMAASDKAGEYIEGLGKTDMARWSELEWTHFIETICGGYVDALCQQQAALGAALGKVQPIP